MKRPTYAPGISRPSLSSEDSADLRRIEREACDPILRVAPDHRTLAAQAEALAEQERWRARSRRRATLWCVGIAVVVVAVFYVWAVSR